MRSDSLILHAASLDTLVAALKDYYKEYSEIASHSGDSRLMVIERYYLRSRSTATGSILIETMQEQKFLVNIIVAGGHQRIPRYNVDTEDPFVNEVKKILLSAKEATITDKDKEESDAIHLFSQRCIICHQSLNKEDLILKCPKCGGVAHKKDMTEWLQFRDYCPSCHAHITEHTLLTIRG
jgi:ribosomal protein L33